MREYGLTILVAAAVTYLLTPLVRRFAIAVGALHAARARDVHTEPVPLVGGLAMYLGLAAALLVASRLTHLSTVFAGTRVASGLLLAGGVVVVLGFVDDRWGLGAITKMAGQVAAGVILVWSGAVVAWLPVPGGGTLSLTSDQQTVLTILVVVVTINAVNFIDGLDGLAAGIVGIGAAAFFLYYYTLTKRLGLDDQTGPALAAAILAGVCLGFLPHNFHPARIFMGDTGSMLLGLLLAYVPISSLASLDPNTLTNPSAYSGGTVNRFPEILPLLVPAIIMLIPYADLLLAVVRRTRAGQSPFSADKKHLQHRLLAIGHSHRGSVLIMYLWAVLFAGTVVLLSIIRTKLLVLGLVTLAGVLILLLASMPRLRPWNRRQLRLSPNIAGPVPPGAPVSAGAPVPAGAGAAVASGVAVPSGAGAALVSGGPVPSGGPVSSGLVPNGGPGASGHSIPPPVSAAAGTAAQGRRRADRGASLDRGRPVDRGLSVDRGPGEDGGAGADRGGSAPSQRRGDLGYGDPPRGGVEYRDPLRHDAGYGDPLPGDSGRGDVAYRDPLRGDAGYGDPLRADAAYGDPLRDDAAYGDSRPGRGSADTGWAARPAGTPWDGKPADPARPAEPAAWDSRPPGPAWDARSAATPPETPASAEAVPGPGSPVAPTDGGWAPDPVGGREPGQWYPGRTDPARTDPGLTDSGRTDPGLTGSGHQDPGLTGSGWTDPARQDSGQWYSGRPEPSQWDSGSWDSRPHDAGSRHASAQGADFEGTGPEDGGLPGPSLGDPGLWNPSPQNAAPQDAGPQDIDPLTPDPARSQPPRPARARPVHPDANEYSEEEESPLLPWRFH
jgi:UDP-GlcNAc:undecaprenyl-phosphate GlcNAc-1-phosphate transferase